MWTGFDELPARENAILLFVLFACFKPFEKRFCYAFQAYLKLVILLALCPAHRRCRLAVLRAFLVLSRKAVARGQTHPRLLADLSEKVFSDLPINMMISIGFSLKILRLGDEKMAQQLRALLSQKSIKQKQTNKHRTLAALLEDQHTVPRTHIR